jgi:tRNA-dihydrouridine synthase B
VPVTVKIRTGTDPEHRNGVTIARIAESAGIQMLTVHGRTRADRFKGQAEYQTIAEIVRAVTIPVIANGDIDSAEKARAVLMLTGAAGVMIGRAAQGQLWLPGAIASALTAGDKSARTPVLSEQLHLQGDHLLRLHAFHGDHLGPRIARKHQAWLLESLTAQQFISAEDARAWRQAFNRIESAEAQVTSLRNMTEALMSAVSANAPTSQMPPPMCPQMLVAA